MHKTNTYIKLTLLAVFATLAGVLFFGLESRKSHSQQQHLQLISKRYQLAYNTIYDQYKQLARNIQSGLLEHYAIEKLYQQLPTADEDLKNSLREELLSTIRPRYTYLNTNMRVKQLHFHLPDNSSFLRLHRPEKFGDSLAGIRETLEYVNQEHLAIDGFEEGRLYSGYRFVFPITAADKSHLGSMEVSFGPEAFIASMMKQYDILSNFFIKEEIAERKVFPEDLSRVSAQSHHTGYLYDKNVLATLQGVTNKTIRVLKPSKKTTDAIYLNAHMGRAESHYDSSLDMVFTTIPVLNPVTGQQNAFLTVRSRSDFFLEEIHLYRVLFSLSLVLAALVLLVFYQQYNRKKVLAGLNDSLEMQVAERTRELQISKEEWEKTFNAIPDIITLQDRKMRIVRANRAAFDYFEMQPEELLGTTCHSLFRGEAKPCGDCPGLLSFADTCKHQGTIEHSSLGKFFQVSSAPILDQDNKVQYIVNVAQDVTDRQSLEKELLQAQKMEAVGTLAGGIAHDFNNILAAILGYAQLIEREAEEGSATGKYVNRLLTAGNRATELVKQILTFSRSNTQKKKPLRVDFIVQEAVKMLRSSLPANIEIQTAIDPDSGLVLADPTNIHQVVVNLCTNASHAIGKENGTLEVSLSSVEIDSEQLVGKSEVEAGVFVVLTVKDDGKGMDEETLARVFEPYFTTKKQGEGSGLGLAVTHGIVEKCDGFITVGSYLGEGSVFHVFLPCVTEDSVVTPLPEVSTPLLTGHESILVVDDEPDLAEICSTLLTHLGYRVSTETDSRTALEKFNAAPESFDLVITDQTMPGLAGEDLARAMLKVRPDLPIILCTGYTPVLSEKQAHEIGIKSFLLKPLQEKDIAKTVRRVLDEPSIPS